jgi:hypothetical protein
MRLPRLAPRAAQPDSRSEPKLKPVPLEKCLPFLLQKALLDNEREHADTLASLLKRAKGLLQGDLISPAYVSQIEEEALQQRVRLLRQQRDYDDVLDQLQLQFDVKPDRLKELEDTVAVPLTRHFGRFSKVIEDEAATEFVTEQLAGSLVAPESAPALRAELLRVCTESALVKGTKLAKGFRELLATWEKLSGKDLNDRLKKLDDEQKKLLDKQEMLNRKDQRLSAADEARLREVRNEHDLGSYERSLRQYESKYVEKGKPKKPADPAAERQRINEFRDVVSKCQKVLAEACNERISALRESWPELPPIEVDKTALLTCDWDKAERVLSTRLKQPPQLTAAKARLRSVRMLAETYRIQQRLAELSYARIRSALDVTPPPTPPGSPPVDPSWAVTKFEELRCAERALAQVKEQLLSTWFNYQIARLGLFVDLGLSSP